MGLIDQAHKNINILKELKPEDTLVGNRFTLQKQDEYVQPENMHELENVIYFTYHQLFFSFNEYKYPPKKVYGLMEDALDNIFDNKKEDPSHLRSLHNKTSILDNLVDIPTALLLKVRQNNSRKQNETGK